MCVRPQPEEPSASSVACSASSARWQPPVPQVVRLTNERAASINSDASTKEEAPA